MSSSPSHPLAGLGAVSVALLAWAFPSVIGKGLELDAVPIVFYRGWIGALWALSFLYLRGGRITWRGLRASLWGGVSLGFDLVFFFTAIKLTTIANATVISALQPALLLFLAPWLFRERLRLPDVVPAFVAMGGVLLVVRGSSDTAAWSLEGDVFAFLTLFAWTGYLVASKKAREKVSASEFAACVTLIATALVTPVAILSPGPLPVPVGPQWGLLAVMALFGWGGHILMNWALGHIPIWIGGTATLAIPVLTSALAALLLDEPLLPAQILGMAVVMVSLAVVGVRSPKLVGAEAGS